MRIRPFKEDDLEKIINIYDNARRAELILAGRTAAFRTLRGSEELSNLYASKVLVALVSERVTGFVAYKDDRIDWLYVNPVHAREGIGEALIRHAIGLMRQESPGCEINIRVLKGNVPAQKLYEKVGFVLEKQMPGEFPGTGQTVQVLCMKLR